jgi:hypothetical protein
MTTGSGAGSGETGAAGSTSQCSCRWIGSRARSEVGAAQASDAAANTVGGAGYVWSIGSCMYRWPSAEPTAFEASERGRVCFAVGEANTPARGFRGTCRQRGAKGSAEALRPRRGVKLGAAARRGDCSVTSTIDTTAGGAHSSASAASAFRFATAAASSGFIFTQ